MRSRHGINAMSSDDTSSPLNKIFGLNRDTPEAKANQLKWARDQMDSEMPSATLDGMAIDDRKVLAPSRIRSSAMRPDRGGTGDMKTSRQVLQPFRLHRYISSMLST